MEEENPLKFSNGKILIEWKKYPKQHRHESEFLREWQDNASSISQTFLVAESTSASTNTNTAIEGYIYLGRGHRQIISSILPLLRRLWPPFLLRYQSLSRIYNRFALYLCIIISSNARASFTKLSCRRQHVLKSLLPAKDFSLFLSRRFNCTDNVSMVKPMIQSVYILMRSRFIILTDFCFVFSKIELYYGEISVGIFSYILIVRS